MTNDTNIGPMSDILPLAFHSIEFFGITHLLQTNPGVVKNKSYLPRYHECIGASNAPKNGFVVSSISEPGCGNPQNATTLLVNFHTSDLTPLEKATAAVEKW